MVTGVACGLQNRYGAFARPGWVRFPHVPAILRWALAALALAGPAALPVTASQDPIPPESPAVVGVEDAAARPDTVPPVTPLGAMIRSLVIPGWGQVEVGRPDRGAIYFGAEAVSLFMVFKSSAKLSAARRSEPEDQALIDSRTGQRENWIVLSVFFAFISGIDAWVSTHFWDFEPRIEAPPDGSIAVGLAFKVDLP